MTDRFVSIEGWNEFEKIFQPKQNHIVPSNNVNFETYGEEWEYVKSVDPRYVWTWVQADMSDILVNGIAFVNRLSYHICEVPWDEDAEYEVLLSVQEECECYDEDREDNNGEFGDANCQECEGYGYITKYVD